MAEVLHTQRPTPPQEIIIVRPDGSRVAVLANPAPIFDERGAMLGAINCLIEITERRQVEQALRESETRFRAIFDQAAVGIALEKRYVRKDGQVTWARVNASSVNDDAGRPLHMLSVVEDINERKRTEEALRQSEHRFRLMIESASDYAIFTLDRSARVTSWNSGAQRLLGYAERGILGESAHRIFTEEDCRRGQPEQEIETARRDDSAADERWHVRKDGSRFWANGRMMAMRDGEGRVQGYVKILRDQTEAKQAQEQLEAHARQQRAVARRRTRPARSATLSRTGLPST